MSLTFKDLEMQRWNGEVEEIKPRRSEYFDEALDMLSNNKSKCRLNWIGAPLEERASLLRDWGVALLSQRGGLSRINCLETGRSYRSIWRDSVPKAAQATRYFSSATFFNNLRKKSRLYRRHNTLVFPERIGNVLLVLPWNDPLVSLAWKVCPALISGNSVIIKPSEFATRVVSHAVDLLYKCGLPKEMLIVAEGGADVGEFLVGHKRVDAVAFTGSSSTARRIIQCANQDRIKKVSVECGGKGFFVYAGDRSDWDQDLFAEVVVRNMFYNQGQICSAPSVLLVPEELEASILNKISTLSTPYVPRSPASGTECGYMNDPSRVESLREFILSSVTKNNFFGQRGEHCEAPENPRWSMMPTILRDLPADSPLTDTELFAPVVISKKYQTFDDAIQEVNSSRYGLANGIWTSDRSLEDRFTSEVVSGNIHINSWGSDPNGIPFGGTKDSGIGREKSEATIDSYTYIKSVYKAL